MSLQLVESFDSLTNNATIRRKYPFSGTGSTTTTVAGGRFLEGLRVLAGFCDFIHLFPSAQQDWYIHFAFWPLNISARTDILTFYENATDEGLDFGSGNPVKQFSVTAEPLGKIAVRRGGSTGTIIAESAINVLFSQVWHSIQVAVHIHNSTGTVVVKVDAVEVINVTGVDTQNAPTSVADLIQINLNTANSGSMMDDLVICDGAGSINNTLLGDVLVEYLRPDANGAITQFTPIIGANWENVDDAQSDDDSTYNSTNVDARQDLYTKPALARIDPTAGVIGLSVNSTVRRDDTGGINSKNIVRSGGTIFEQSERVLSTDYLTFYDILEEDPDGSVAWTEAKVNAMQFGIKAVIP